MFWVLCTMLGLNGLLKWFYKKNHNFLSLCFQALEAAKRLQLGKLRMDMLKYEVNKIKRGGGSPSNSAQG